MLTVPVNLLTGAIVMVEEPETPTSTGAGDAAAIVKSVIMNEAVAECTRLPLVPVTVSV